MKQIKLAKTLIVLLLAYFFIYNAYFGWNMYSQSDAEKTCDMIFSNGIKIAVAIYLIPLLKIYEILVKNIKEWKAKNADIK